MAFVVNLLIGLLFGAGLVVSGMTDPAKVLAFLDIAGAWDPSLAFVMGGAVLVAFVGYRLAWKRGRPLTAARFDLPDTAQIDLPVVVGPAIFGVGWGLSGYCPGPAIAALGLGAPATLVFLVAMAAGMAATRRLSGRVVLRAAE